MQMKPLIYSAAIASAVLAGGLTANAASTATTNPSTPPYAAPVIADADAMKGADELHRTNIQQQLQDQLAKAGYTDVKIAPSSFFIRAKDKKGDPVAMVVGPDSFTEVTEIAKAPGATAQQTPKTTNTMK